MKVETQAFEIDGVKDCKSALPLLVQYINSGELATDAEDDGINLQSASALSAVCTGAGDATFNGGAPAPAPAAFGRKLL